MTEETKPSELDNATDATATVDKSEQKQPLSQKSKPTKQDSRESSAMGAYLVSFMALALVAVLGYFGYLRYLDIQQQLTDVQQSNRAYQTALDRIQQQQLKQNAEVVAQLEASEKRLDTDIKGFTDQLLNMNEAISNFSIDEDKGWLVDEAYYLLRIANNRLMFMKDVETAIYLLTEADNLLGQIDDPNLFAIRKKLSEDRQRLSAWPKLDSTGLAIRIAALQSRVNQLPMVQVIQKTELVAEQVSPDTWYEHLLYSLQQLGNQWFTVRQHGSGYTPIISESEEQQLRFAVMMTLQTIQYAILHQNDNLYQANLLQLKSRLNNFFDNQDSAVQTLLVEIAQLLQLRVGHETISGLTSVTALATYIEQRATPSRNSAPSSIEEEAVVAEEGESKP